MSKHAVMLHAPAIRGGLCARGGARSAAIPATEEAHIGSLSVSIPVSCPSGPRASDPALISRLRGRYDFGISLSGSTNGLGTTLASRSPSGVATLSRVSSRASAVGTIA